MFFTHFKYLKLLKNIYKQENLPQNLSQLCGSEFRTDWWGRMYAVLNPYIVDGKYDPSGISYEYQEKGITDEAYVENWIMNKLLIAKQFVKTNNLFDILTYEIKKLDDNGNFLFVIKSITHDDFIKTLKWLSGIVGGLAVISILMYIYFFIF